MFCGIECGLDGGARRGGSVLRDADEVRRDNPEGDAAPALLWFQRDLRLHDNPSVLAAVGSKRPVLPIFILERDGPARAPGAASLWWLDKSLKSLGADLEAVGSRLSPATGRGRRRSCATSSPRPGPSC